MHMTLTWHNTFQIQISLQIVFLLTNDRFFFPPLRITVDVFTQ